MQVKINDELREIKAVQMEDHVVEMIDQRWLPFRIQIKQLPMWQDTIKAIKDLVTRGAGSVGVAGAFALAQAAHQLSTKSVDTFEQELEEAAQMISQARPTAVTLNSAVKFCLENAAKGVTIEEKQELIDQAARQIQSADIHASEAIGKKGSQLLKHGTRVLTHCNAGPLAIQDYGSALAVIYFAHLAGNLSMVYVSETRPWLQGSRLTTWELQQWEIPHQLIADSACGYLFSTNQIDTVIVGADRIAANGDVANKIGTYEKAVLAQVHKVPFYVAAPTFAIDLSCPSGNQITIEERPPKEVRTVIGRLPTGEMGPVQVAPDHTDAFNPIFDITPAKYLTGLITEHGVLTKLKPKNIQKLVSQSFYNSG
jgi:S-methyl-5-thioribose-1-phosphate isomerase